MSHRVDRIVFRAHGFIHLNGEGEPCIADSGRETDHPSVPKLRAVDLDLQTVKPNSPHFPGTSLQRDRWDFQPEHHTRAFVKHFYRWNHVVSIVTPATPS